MEFKKNFHSEGQSRFRVPAHNSSFSVNFPHRYQCRKSAMEYSISHINDIPNLIQMLQNISAHNLSCSVNFHIHSMSVCFADPSQICCRLSLLTEMVRKNSTRNPLVQVLLWISCGFRINGYSLQHQIRILHAVSCAYFCRKSTTHAGTPIVHTTAFMLKVGCAFGNLTTECYKDVVILFALVVNF